jgi:hypothetical protein
MSFHGCHFLINSHVSSAVPPLWSSGQSSWLHIQRSGFDSRRYQIIWEAMGLEQGQLSLVSTIEELLGRNSSGCGLENREYYLRDSSRWPRGTLYAQKLALTSATNGGRPVGIVRSRTQAAEFFKSVFSFFGQDFGLKYARYHMRPKEEFWQMLIKRNCKIGSLLNP